MKKEVFCLRIFLPSFFFLGWTWFFVDIGETDMVYAEKVSYVDTVNPSLLNPDWHVVTDDEGTSEVVQLWINKRT